MPSDSKTTSGASASSKEFQPRSRNQVAVQGWGSRKNFQLSYGLKLTPEDFEEGNAILDAMIEGDRYDWEQNQKNASGGK